MYVSLCERPRNKQRTRDQTESNSFNSGILVSINLPCAPKLLPVWPSVCLTFHLLNVQNVELGFPLKSLRVEIHSEAKRYCIATLKKKKWAACMVVDRRIGHCSWIVDNFLVKLKSWLLKQESLVTTTSEQLSLVILGVHANSGSTPCSTQ